MIRQFKPYLAGLGLVALLLLGKFLWFPGEKAKAGGLKDGKKQASTVSVFVAGEGTEDHTLYASGTVIATEEAELKSEVNGKVVFLSLPEGKTVQKGTLLLKVNDAELQAQLNKIRIQIRQARNSEDRMRKLLEIDGTSKAEYENAEVSLQTFLADSAFIRTQIAKTEIRAPFTGIIGIRNISAGSYITPNQTIAKIHQINPVKVDFTIPEKYSSLVKTGDNIQFKSENKPDLFKAKITVKDPEVDLSSRSVRYRAEYLNNRNELFPGSYVKVLIPVKNSAQSIFVPTEAVVPFLKGKKLFVVKQGLAEERIIETGLRTEDQIQVLSGLQKGDSVVVNGNFQLKNGVPVKVAKKPGNQQKETQKTTSGLK